MPKLDGRSGGQAIRYAALTLLAVALVAHFAWVLLAPLMPAIISLLILGAVMYFFLGRRQ